MKSVTVTIGRNVGSGDPLIATQWNDFSFAVREAVEAISSELTITAPYKGEWEGVKEEARIFFGLDVDDSGVEFLRNRLETLATRYGQEAIGLSVGESDLVTPFVTAAPVHATE